jgi:hypothetical protein
MMRAWLALLVVVVASAALYGCSQDRPCVGDGCRCEDYGACETTAECIDDVCRLRCGRVGDPPCPRDDCCQLYGHEDLDEWACMPPKFCASPPCTSDNCPGCCMGDICVSGETDMLCGDPTKGCAYCAPGRTTCVDHECVRVTPCTPTCAEHVPCGDNGCGGSCGTCGADQTCYSGMCYGPPRDGGSPGDR